MRGDLVLPAIDNGQPVPGKAPVLLTITAYNKSVIGAGAGAILAGSDPKYFVKRGYATLVVDARGTGQPDDARCVRALREHDRRHRDERRHPVAHLVAVVELRRERRAHDLVHRVIAHIRDTSISRAAPPTASR